MKLADHQVEQQCENFKDWDFNSMRPYIKSRCRQHAEMIIIIQVNMYVYV